jgi:purine-binding chemotaxis protein CheW
MNTTLTATTGITGLAGKYLTFRLGDETYGISVLKVREIIRHTYTTIVPQMPDYIKGVINLRGKIIPVVDLRLKFGMTASDHTEQSCIVVVQVTRPDKTTLTMGLVVDAVEEVANIAASDIEQTPDFGVQIETAYILGMAKIKGVVKALLDIDRVLAAQSVEALSGL